MRWAPASAAALALSCLLGLIGCRSAAVVFFDLPPEWATPDSAGRARADSVAVRAARSYPAIEETFDEGEALEILPRDDRGHVDWVAAERDSLIRPRWGPAGAAPPPGAGWEHEVVFPTGARFLHAGHTRWLACSACHSDFQELRTRERPSPLKRAEECGSCHGPVAFPVQSCGRCHPDRAGEGGRRLELLPGDLRMARPATGAEGGTYGIRDNSRALFRHWVHRARYRCVACHPDPFPMEAGVTLVTHAQIQRGEACGTCHNDRTAFGLAQCDRCHDRTDPEAMPPRDSDAAAAPPGHGPADDSAAVSGDVRGP